MDNFKCADSMLSISLRKNCFSQTDNSYIGAVKRNTVTVENLIASAAESNSGVDSYTLQHSAYVLEDESLKALRAGNAVNLLGLGTLYITIDGSVEGDNADSSSVAGFKLGFTPSTKAQNILSSLKVDKVVYASSSPVIDVITNNYNQGTDGILSIGKGITITGNHLKIAGDGSGIWLCPLDTDGETLIKEEGSWIKIDDSTINCNKPRTLSFYLPDTDVLSSGSKYKIVLRTRYCSGKTLRKNISETYSSTITVE